jgi:uncharacterized protein (TIGR00730 family)
VTADSADPTGAATPEELVEQLLVALGVTRDRKLSRELLLAATDFLAGHPSTLDLRIAGAALHEMGEAFEMFAPFRDTPKVTVFGSARTKPDDPLYTQARQVAERFAAGGWMVVTGAGPGIMQAAMEGAGREHSIGVQIRLPFEQRPNPIIAGDDKYVTMKYFFTRKLALVRESKGFICLPGGFGTLDETFELLTLTQTGKGVPVPIVFLDTPGDPYWETVHDLVQRQLVARGLVAAADTGLYLVTDDHDVAVREVLDFYASYDSMRYVGDLLVIRTRHRVTDAQLEVLNANFGHLCRAGTITRVDPLEPERREGDRVELPRIAFTFAKHGYGELRAMIDTLNDFVT